MKVICFQLNSLTYFSCFSDPFLLRTYHVTNDEDPIQKTGKWLQPFLARVSQTDNFYLLALEIILNTIRLVYISLSVLCDPICQLINNLKLTHPVNRLPNSNCHEDCNVIRLGLIVIDILVSVTWGYLWKDFQMFTLFNNKNSNKKILYKMKMLMFDL